MYNFVMCATTVVIQKTFNPHTYAETSLPINIIRYSCSPPVRLCDKVKRSGVLGLEKL